MRGRWGWLGLALLLMLDVWLRGHAFWPALRPTFGFDPYFATSREPEPLDCDEAIYGYIGGRLARGAVMYRDLTENKPPGGYWLYALAVAIGGPTELTIRVLPVPFVQATLAIVWWLARRLGGEIAAFLAGLGFALASTDPYLYGESANMEHMINAFALGSLAALVVGWSRSDRRWLLASGALLGASTMVKQTSLLHAAVYGVALFARRAVRVGDSPVPRSWRVRLCDVLALESGVGFVIALAALVLVMQGAGREAFDDIVHYGRALATETPPPPGAPPFLARWVFGNADPKGQLPWPFGSTDYLVWWGTGTWPFWLAGMVGTIVLGISGSPARPRWLVAAWTLSAWVQVALPGLFWQHYYLLPIPGLAVALGVAAGDACRGVFHRGGKRGRSLLLASLTTIALVATAWLQFVEYLSVAPRDLVKDRGGMQWVVDRDLGREIGRRARGLTDPSLFVWGWQGPLYFYSGLDGVTPRVFVDDFLKNFADTHHPQAARRIERTMKDLREHPPLVVFTGYPPFSALRPFLEERYIPSRIAPGLWIRRDAYADFESRNSG